LLAGLVVAHLISHCSMVGIVGDTCATCGGRGRDQQPRRRPVVVDGVEKFEVEIVALPDRDLRATPLVSPTGSRLYFGFLFSSSSAGRVTMPSSRIRHVWRHPLVPATIGMTQARRRRIVKSSNHQIESPVIHTQIRVVVLLHRRSFLACSRGQCVNPL
jgi:hypothetical protein